MRGTGGCRTAGARWHAARPSTTERRAPTTPEAPSAKPQAPSAAPKKDGRLVIHRTAVPHSDYPRSGVAPPFFFPPPPVGCCAAREGQREPWLPSPGRMICPTWFVTASAASRSGSRTTPSHCTPRHRIGVEGTRDWSPLPGLVSLQDRRSPEPLVASAISPDIPPELAGRRHPRPEVPDRSPPTVPQDTVGRKPRKCLSFFGLRHIIVDNCGYANPVV